MPTALERFNQSNMKLHLRPDVQPGDTVRVHIKIVEGEKERIQVFEGVVLARKHGKGISATITVRKVSQGVGVERVFPIHSPIIEKIEVVRRSKVRRAKLYFLRMAKGKKARLRAKAFNLEVPEEELEPTTEEQPAQEPTKEATHENTKESAPVEEIAEEAPIEKEEEEAPTEEEQTAEEKEQKKEEAPIEESTPEEQKPEEEEPKKE